MTLPSQETVDIIATKILLDAKQALSDLKAWQITAKEAGKETEYFKSIVSATAKQMNGDFKAATAAVNQFAKALNVNPQFISKIGKDLQVLDSIAQKSLGGVSQKTAESSARMTLLSNAIQQMAAKGKLSIDQVVSSLRTLNASAGTKMGKLGFSDRSIVEAGEVAKKTSAKIAEVGTAGEKAGKQVQTGFQRAISGVNFLRIALGALVSMLLFQVIQVFQRVFTSAIDNLRETELAVYNLVNAEKKLSEQGIDVTPKGLQEIIDSVTELVPILSKIQSEELVSRIASNVAPSLRLGTQEMEKLAKAIGFAYVQNKALGYSFDEIEKSFTESTLTGKVSQGINKYGVKITDLIVKQHAVSMGLVESEEAFDDLDGEMKAHVQAVSLIDYAYQEFAKNQSTIPQYTKTTDAAIEQTKVAWSNLLTALGKLSGPVIIEFLSAITRGLVFMLVGLEAVTPYIKIFVADVAGAARALDLLSRGDFNIGENFKSGFQDAMSSFKELEDYQDTLTNPSPIVPQVENEDALKALEDIEDKIQEIILSAQQKQDDLDLKLQQKQDDLDIEYQRKEEDAAINHAQKIEDINLDAAQKVEDAKRHAQEEELKAEEDLLQKLKELRQRYLLDLEEALHARDARQVLRLMKEYKLDKQNLLDRAKLAAEQRKRDLAEELAAIERERLRRIQDEQIAYQRKLADLATAKAREQEELQLWYQREQEDIKRNVQQKLERLLAGYIAEEKIHETEQAKIRAILAKYFSQDMALVDQMVQFMNEKFAEMSQTAAAGFAQIGQGITNFSGAIPVDSLGSQSGLGQGITGFAGGFAEGGTLIANKPTTVKFGEKGLEAATFTPIGRSGRDISKLFGDISSGVNGQILVAVDLSEGLEGRIVQKSMNGVADVIGRVNRRKK